MKTEMHISENYEICATCNFWKGSRLLNSSSNRMEYDSYQKGLCIYGDNKDTYIYSTFNCSSYKRWNKLPIPSEYKPKLYILSIIILIIALIIIFIFLKTPILIALKRIFILIIPFIFIFYIIFFILCELYKIINNTIIGDKIIHIILHLKNWIAKNYLKYKLNLLENNISNNLTISPRNQIVGPLSFDELFKKLNEIRKAYLKDKKTDRENVKSFSGVLKDWFVKRFYGLKMEGKKSILVYSYYDSYSGISSRWDRSKYIKIIKYNNEYYLEEYSYNYEDID